MSAVGTSKGILEIAKFAVYVAVPIGLTYGVATNSETLQKLMGFVKFCLSCYRLLEPFISYGV